MTTSPMYPMYILVLMGVSGTGKSTIGKTLSESMNWPLYEADDFHSQQNKDKMAKGLALNDEDRKPWLQALSNQIYSWWRAAKHNSLSTTTKDIDGCVVTCSCLKKIYRNLLMNEGKTTEDGDAKPPIIFVQLKGDFGLIKERITNRKGHFINSKLLQSQFDILEPLEADEPNIQINVDKTPDEIVSHKK